MFNKVDEKSQLYSESTEALGEITQMAIAMPMMFPGLIGMVSNIFKIAETGKPKMKNIVGAVVSFVSMIVVPTILNIIITKEQKSASKVADMLAIKELDDYRNFADYSEENKEQKEIETQKKTSSNPYFTDFATFLNKNNTQINNLIG